MSKILKNVVKKTKTLIFDKNIKKITERKKERITLTKPDWQKTKEERKFRKSWTN